jgi:hypothetical protein
MPRASSLPATFPAGLVPPSSTLYDAGDTGQNIAAVFRSGATLDALVAFYRTAITAYTGQTPPLVLDAGRAAFVARGSVHSAEVAIVPDAAAGIVRVTVVVIP